MLCVQLKICQYCSGQIQVVSYDYSFLGSCLFFLKLLTAFLFFLFVLFDYVLNYPRLPPHPKLDSIRYAIEFLLLPWRVLLSWDFPVFLQSGQVVLWVCYTTVILELYLVELPVGFYSNSGHWLGPCFFFFFVAQILNMSVTKEILKNAFLRAEL